MDANTENTDYKSNEVQLLSENSGCPISENDTEKKISKNQLKKQLKREKWLAIKQEKRREAKQKRKLRFAMMREKGEDTGPTRKRLKLNTMRGSSCKIRVVIDLSMDDRMTEKDVNSLTCQLQHSYSANRRAKNPMQLYLCGLDGKTKERLDLIGDYKNWDLYKESRHYEEVFPKENLVYLTSESPNVLTSLSEDKVYIIGGLVDHNKLKGFCHNLAEEKGLAHAQLPISEYLNMKTRKVLAVNHVFSILLRYTECHDWKAAFLAELPARKQALIKDEDECSHEQLDKTGLNLLQDNLSSSEEQSLPSQDVGLPNIDVLDSSDQTPVGSCSNLTEPSTGQVVTSSESLLNNNTSRVDPSSHETEEESS
ncbi:unnamed protein product [Lymnaea stagnalis]|uniref:tRNA (guanine(9)-N(1))-methyltransferase n=1 Tax=Lymnaea stagnalis TaxID=6523 RepID=A0AAV2H1C1_LYMST